VANVTKKTVMNLLNYKPLLWSEKDIHKYTSVQYFVHKFSQQLYFSIRVKSLKFSISIESFSQHKLHCPAIKLIVFLVQNMITAMFINKK